MPWIAAAAIVGSSLIGAGASYAGGQAQADAANNAARLQNEQFQQTRADLAPWRQVGQGALYQINDLAGLGGTTGNAFAIPTLSQANPTVGSNAGGMYSGGNAFAQQGQTPGVAAAMAAGPHSHGKLSLGSVDPMNLFGMSNNASPIQDIAAALQNGVRPEDISPASWAKIGFGPGGSAPGGQMPAYAGAPTGSPGVDAATAQGNAFAKFRTDPGYEFARAEGQRGLESSAAARGILNSGATAKALTRYGQGVADQQYGTYYNRLASLAGIGQTATNQTAAYGANAANAQGNAFMNAGNARASAYSGVAGAANQGVENYLTYQGQHPAYTNANGGYYNGGYLAPFNSPAAAMGY